METQSQGVWNSICTMLNICLQMSFFDCYICAVEHTSMPDTARWRVFWNDCISTIIGIFIHMEIIYSQIYCTMISGGYFISDQMRLPLTIESQFIRINLKINLISVPGIGVWILDVMTSLCGKMLTHYGPMMPYGVSDQWIGSSLVLIMAWRLFGTKRLPEPMLTHCQFNPKGQISVKFQ